MPEQKYSADIMQRVAMMRTRVLKNGSDGSTHVSRESASSLEEDVRSSRPRLIFSWLPSSSKLVFGGGLWRRSMAVCGKAS